MERVIRTSKTSLTYSPLDHLQVNLNHRLTCLQMNLNHHPTCRHRNLNYQVNLAERREKAT